MEAEALAEMGYVVVASLAGVVGDVEGYAYIAPEEQHLEVVTQAKACAEGEVASQVVTHREMATISMQQTIVFCTRKRWFSLRKSYYLLGESKKMLRNVKKSSYFAT